MIVTNKELADSTAAHFIRHKPGDLCFVCGDPLTVPYVIWQGNNGNKDREAQQIALHPRCAKDLSGNLLSDGAIASNEPVICA